jgi:hypothetical protein
LAYLEVKIENGDGGTIATSANGVSLARGSGCLAFFFGSAYPSAVDYFRALKLEGWTLLSTQTTNRMGMIDGLLFMNSDGMCTFAGHGRYLIEWDDNGWYLVDDRDKFEN